MNDIDKIVFRLKDEQTIEIQAINNSGLCKPIVIGQIFSKGSYSGKNSIQICGFDSLQGPWSCGAFNHSQDICLKWIDEEQWIEKKN